jgi:iron-sulfur cluster assembly accessory protein
MLKKININYCKSVQPFFIYRSISSASTELHVKKRKPIKAIITVSPSASLRISKMFSLLEAPHPLGIRISINKRGCNGMNYTMKYIKNNEEESRLIIKDEIINIDDKIKIFVDPLAVFAIVGTVMDWKENEISSEFTFINPNAKGFCGCGESFNM